MRVLIARIGTSEGLPCVKFLADPKQPRNGPWTELRGRAQAFDDHEKAARAARVLTDAFAVIDFKEDVEKAESVAPPHASRS